MPASEKKSNSPVADRITGECLAVRIRLLNRTITAIYDEALRPLGLTAGQLNVLVVVAKLGPVSPKDVARKLNMEKSTVSRNVDRMRAHGWLITSTGETGRSQLLNVSPRGHSLLEETMPLWEAAQAQAIAILGQRGARSIHSVADAVWAKLGRD